MAAEGKGQDVRKERKFIGMGFFFSLFVCLSWFGFITTERSTRSKFILYVGKGEERMLKLKLFALSPAPVLDMW